MHCIYARAFISFLITILHAAPIPIANNQSAMQRKYARLHASHRTAFHIECATSCIHAHLRKHSVHTEQAMAKSEVEKIYIYKDCFLNIAHLSLILLLLLYNSSWT